MSSQPDNRGRMPDPLRDLLVKEADRCVACGMCLPVCPTYGLLREEGDSPRGRISLIAALARGELEPDAGLATHLDRCLVCLRCQPVCPAGVRYGTLIDGARALLRRRGVASASSGWSRFLVRTLGDPRRARRLSRGLRWYRELGLQRVARATGLTARLGVERLDRSLENRPRSGWRAWYPPEGERRGEVALFVGCTGGLLDAGTVDDAIRLLTASGFGVHVPPRQGCCGALARHEGDPEEGDLARLRNLEAFEGLQVEANLFLASGCGVELQEGGRGVRWMDPLSFLEERWSSAGVPPLRPMKKRAVLHLPCSQRRLREGGEGVLGALRRIPELEVEVPTLRHGCCGAAGLYPHRQPEIAARLGEAAVEDLWLEGADLLLTTNVGCALHLRQHAPGLRVCHPLSLLAEQLN